MKESRRSFLVLGSAVGSASLLSGLAACGGDSTDVAADPVTPPPAPTPPPVPAPTPPPLVPPEVADVEAVVSFRSRDAAARLDSHYAGLSYEKHRLAVPMFTGSNAALIAFFRLLGPSVLRIGANAVDRASWNGAVDDLTPIRPADIDALAAFVQATGWQVIYGVNMARNTATNAAKEAAYVASRLGPSLLAWEIGNEPDLYTSHEYRPGSWGYDEYLKEWRELRDAMSEASPGVPFAGPATTFNVVRFTLPFAEDEGENLAMLTHHYYRANRDDPGSTLALLLQPHAALSTELSRLVPAAAEQGIPHGVRLAEANSFYNGGVQNVSNAYGTGLWVMEFMFTCALAGCTGVNMHSGGSGPGYTPIADGDGVVVEARAEFYGMLMFAQVAQGMPLQGIVDTDASINVSAWGVARDDSGLNAILINKDGERSVNMRLEIDTVATHFESLWLRGTELSASSGHTLGGVAIDSNGGWAPQVQEQIAVTDGGLTVLLPPASAVRLRSL